MHEKIYFTRIKAAVVITNTYNSKIISLFIKEPPPSHQKNPNNNKKARKFKQTPTTQKQITIIEEKEKKSLFVKLNWHIIRQIYKYMIWIYHMLHHSFFNRKEMQMQIYTLSDSKFTAVSQRSMDNILTHSALRP